MDYESADPLIVTLPATSTLNGHMFTATLDILNDSAVEGIHNFTAAVQNTSLITPASPATITIIDNDSELLSHSLQSALVKHIYSYLHADIYPYQKYLLQM